jgi:hypothetical protein
MSAKPHRAHGEGSITVRKGRPKPYMAQIALRGQRISQSFATRTEATRWIQDIQNKSRNVSDVGLLASSIEEAIQIWLDYKKLSKSLKIYLGYKRVADKYIIPQIGKRRVFDVKQGNRI